VWVPPTTKPTHSIYYLKSDDATQKRAARKDFREHIGYLHNEYKNHSRVAAKVNRQQFVALSDRLCAWSREREHKLLKSCGKSAALQIRYDAGKLARVNKQWDWLRNQKTLSKEKLIVKNHGILAMFLVHCIIDLEKDSHYAARRMTSEVLNVGDLVAWCKDLILEDRIVSSDCEPRLAAHSLSISAACGA